MKLRITLKPLAPYFFGNERTTPFGNEKLQRALVNPYFTRSEKLPSQSALFGVLRYLGIRQPTPDFRLTPEDRDNIGTESYQLTKPEQQFPHIYGISPLMLAEVPEKGGLAAQILYCIPPRNHCALTKKTGDFTPYLKYCRVTSTGGQKRLLPLEYNEKLWDRAELLSLNGENAHKLYGDCFRTTLRVGINRAGIRQASAMAENQRDTEQSGFFKKEYVVLDPRLQFLFEADVSEDFLPENAFSAQAPDEPYTRTVYMGQGHTPFLASVYRVPAGESPMTQLVQNTLSGCFPSAEMDGSPAQRLWYAYAASDLYYTGDIADLRQNCALMLADAKDYRVFTTKYPTKPAESISSQDRYGKNEELLRLIRAGSVFVFTKEEQQQRFRQMLQEATSLVDTDANTDTPGELFRHAQLAGFNYVYYF